MTKQPQLEQQYSSARGQDKLPTAHCRKPMTNKAPKYNRSFPGNQRAQQRRRIVTASELRSTEPTFTQSTVAKGTKVPTGLGSPKLVKLMLRFRVLNCELRTPSMYQTREL